jgi:hypothetical protein
MNIAKCLRQTDKLSTGEVFKDSETNTLPFMEVQTKALFSTPGPTKSK